MGSHRPSPFWRGVPGHPERLRPPRLDGLPLSAAVRAVLEADGPSAAFRRHRELVDMAGRFRYFDREGRGFVAKRSDAAGAGGEVARAREAARALSGLRLRDGMRVEVVVPSLVELPDGEAVLLTEYAGRTLHAHRPVAAGLFPETVFAEVLRALLSRGIAWGGFVPRNVARAPDGAVLRLLDWENAEFHAPGRTRLDGLFLFRLAVGWSPLYGDWRAFLRRVRAYGADAALDDPGAGLDAFERAYREMSDPTLPPERVRRVCAETCLDSEAVPDGRRVRGLSADEAGHLVSDLLEPPLQVLYSLVTAELARRGPRGGYRRFLRALTRALQLACADGARFASVPLEEPRRAALLVLLAGLDGAAGAAWERVAAARTTPAVLGSLAAPRAGAAAAGVRLLRMRGRTGWEAARARAAALDALLAPLFRRTRALTHADGGLELLARGSLGQGLVTARSDVDFEVSGPLHPDGHAGQEAVVTAVLRLLGLGAEGSAGRPRTHDVTCGGGPRDLHEWMELRVPGSPERRVWWNEDPAEAPAERWAVSSRYEAEEHPPSPKHLFFQSRAAVARASYRAGFRLATTPAQLGALRGIIGGSAAERLEGVARAALALREADEAAPEGLPILGCVQDELGRLCAELRLPAPGGGPG